jgi:transposase
MIKLPKVYVGVDISKKYLDICLHPLNKTARIVNSAQGIEQLLKLLTNFEVEQIACEATGGYERAMYQALANAHYKVWRVEPKRIKAFIVSEGIKAKTDKIDAKMIALFASKKSPSYESVQLSDQDDQLRNLVALKSSLTTTAAMVKTQLQQAYNADCIKILTKHLHFLEKQIAALESKITVLIKNDVELDKKAQIITSIPGIGKGTASVILAMLPELGKIDNKHAAALVGVAPFIKQSGNCKGYAKISGGRSAIRCILYMAALSAINHNSVLVGFYKRLVSAGKKAKVAIVAVMRKLVVYMNTLVRKSELWKTSTV